MSAAVKAIVGVVLIVVGAALSATPFAAAAPFLENAGIALLLNAAASLFIKAPRQPPLGGIGINYSGTLEARRILYGNSKRAGVNVIPPLP